MDIMVEGSRKVVENAGKDPRVDAVVIQLVWRRTMMDFWLRHACVLF